MYEYRKIRVILRNELFNINLIYMSINWIGEVFV